MNLPLGVFYQEIKNAKRVFIPITNRRRQEHFDVGSILSTLLVKQNLSEKYLVKFRYATIVSGTQFSKEEYFETCWWSVTCDTKEEAESLLSEIQLKQQKLKQMKSKIE